MYGGWHVFVCIPSRRKEQLMKAILSYEPDIKTVQQARVLLVGPIGAGKSTFFNSINSVFRGNMTCQAIAGTAGRSVTTQVPAQLLFFVIWCRYAEGELCPLFLLQPDHKLNYNNVAPAVSHLHHQGRETWWSCSSDPVWHNGTGGKCWHWCEHWGLAQHPQRSHKGSLPGLNYPPKYPPLIWSTGRNVEGFAGRLITKDHASALFTPQLNPLTPLQVDSPGFKQQVTLNDVIHCLVYVVDTCKISLLSQKMLDKFATIRKKANAMG